MKTEIVSDRIMTEEGALSGYLYLENGKITAVTTVREPADVTFDYTGLIVAPGFIDLHTHGGGGYAFLSEDPAEIARGVNFHLAHGTTTILPTVTAAPIEEMHRAARAITAAKRAGLCRANVPGVHLEGPFLSREQAGAQCPTFLTAPQKDAYLPLLSDPDSEISRWTYAPESDADGAFCRALVDHGVIPSAGHTNATYPEMLRAEVSGLSLVTHLYSCTSTVTRKFGFRSAGVIESVYLSEGLSAEIIADGKHLPPELIRLVVKILGKDRVALVTDSLAIAGTDVREGEMSGTAFIVEDGVCKLRDRSAFAGSIATADVLVRTLTRDAGFSLSDALTMACATPARLLGLKKGILAPGYDADLAVFDDDVRLASVFVGGERVALS